MNSFYYILKGFQFVLITIFLISPTLSMEEREEESLDTRSTVQQTQNSVIRKSVRTLTNDEKGAYINGVRLLKSEIINDPTYGNINTYDKYVKMHDDFMNAVHDGPVFLPWHREFILKFEQDLQRVLQKQNFGLPYWDWENDDPDTTKNPIWDDNFMGGEGYPLSTGQFKTNWTVLGGKFGTILWRAFGQDPMALTLPTKKDVGYVVNLSMEYDIYPWNDKSESGFRNNLEGYIDDSHFSFNSETQKHDRQQRQLHNRVHRWVGGQMSDVNKSPNDPIFWLHHSNIDRIWAMWQSKFPTELNPATTTYPRNQPAGQTLNDTMVPWNDITPANVLDYRALRYTYQFEGLMLVVPYGKLPNVNRIFVLSSDDENTWSYPHTPNTTWETYDAPSAVSFNSKLYFAMRGSSDDNIWVSSYDGAKWTKAAYRVPNPPNQKFVTKNAPSLTTSRQSGAEKLYIAVREYNESNEKNNRLLISQSSNGESWGSYSTPNPKWRISDTPCLADFNSKLCVAMRGIENDIWIGWSYNNNWSQYKPKKFAGWKTLFPLSLANYNGKLYLAIVGEDYKVYITSASDVTNKDSWDYPKPFSDDITTNYPVSLTTFRPSDGGVEKLFLAMKERNLQHVMKIYSYNGNSWTHNRSWNLEDQMIFGSPCLTSFDTRPSIN